MANQITAGRPLGGTEFSWWLGAPGGTGISVFLFLVSRPVSRSLLESALRRLQTSHPILRTHLTTTGPRQPAFSFADSPSPPLRFLSASDLPSSPSAPPSPFHAVLEHELNQNPWSDLATAHPVLFATAYEGLPEPGWSAVALRLHAAVCDRTSAGTIFEELLRLLDGRSVEEEGLNPALEDLISKQDSWKPFWARGKDMVGYSINGLRSAILPLEDTTSARRSSVVRLAMSAEDTQKLLYECKERGVKLCGAMAASAMIAAHSSKNLQNDQYETYTIATLIDCRKYLEPALKSHNLGNYHSAVINTHSVNGAEKLWELAKRCHEAYSTALNNKKHLKDITELNFLMTKAIENPQLTASSSQRTALITLYEEPAVYDSSELQQQLAVEDCIGCASMHGAGPSIAVTDVIRDGKLECAVVYSSPVQSRKQIEELLEHMKRILLSKVLCMEN